MLITGACTTDSLLDLGLLTRFSCGSSETSACCEILLRRRGARQATFLAPTKKARRFAIFGAILTRHCIALSALQRNANRG